MPSGSDHYFHTDCMSVRPSQNFKIKRQSLPARTVGWPSGSLMTPVLLSLLSFQKQQKYFHVLLYKYKRKMSNIDGQNSSNNGIKNIFPLFDP